eukprot:TRINITY_DN34549_c0_g1_i1.p1 TRINITY_DN34549_c0_g1~~TRINITY_DN34549_c0_g1_i1.p1  ORF type:complete len:441 (-),score=69.15 TRINITY_DN34549_c0_g1_i1:35-1357(-)
MGMERLKRARAALAASVCGGDTRGVSNPRPIGADGGGCSSPSSASSPTRRQRCTMMQEMREMGIDPMGDLRDLGYEYSLDGRLHKVDSEEGFAFESQEHYDSLADAIASYVMLLLEDEVKLRPLWLPLGVGPGDGCPIFVSEGFETARRLLLIIQGSGRVRAGTWGCSLCINQDLHSGSMLPCVARALQHRYGVIVFNPNLNKCEGKRIEGSESPERHVAYVMEHVVAKTCRAGVAVDILAHSNGGRALLQFLCRADGVAATSACRGGDGAEEQVACSELVDGIRHIVFTDSYHTAQQVSFLSSRLKDLLADPSRTVNFVPHSSPVGTPVSEWLSQEYTMRDGEKGCKCLSAETQDHASTNFTTLDWTFDFFTAGDCRTPCNTTDCPTCTDATSSPTGSRSTGSFRLGERVRGLIPRRMSWSSSPRKRSWSSSRWRKDSE